MASLLFSASLPRCGTTSTDCPASCSYVSSSPSYRSPNKHLSLRDISGRQRLAAASGGCCAIAGLPLDLPTLALRDRGIGDTTAYDLLGLGQAMVDFSGVVGEDFLSRHGLPKGGRRVISVSDRAAVIEAPATSKFELNAGGSLANTLADCAVLGRAAQRQSSMIAAASRPLRIGMAGCIGDDHLGEYFQTQLAHAGVEWITKPAQQSGTGTVIVCTTPDAQRSFLSYPGTCDEVKLCAATEDAIRSSRILVVEGYLWELPNAASSIKRAISIAREAGTLVALTMADATVALRHRSVMLEAIGGGADLIFTNAAEAAALLGQPTDEVTAEQAALQLGCLCPMAVVTDGSKGSFITALGQLHVLPPHWLPKGPVDTCGAGDAYAAGVLYGYLNGFDIRQMGRFATQVAACVISRQGPELIGAHAEALIAHHSWPYQPDVTGEHPAMFHVDRLCVNDDTRLSDAVAS